MRTTSRWLSASAPFIAGLAWLLYAFIVYKFNPSYYRPSAPVDYLAIAVYSGGLVLLAPAVAGIHARQSASAGLDARIGFCVAFAGAVMAGVGDFGEDAVRIQRMVGLYFSGILLLLVGLALFGLGTMRARVLPLWCGALLLVSPIVGTYLGGLFSQWRGTLLFGLIWILLGLALWFDRSKGHA